MSKLIAEVIPIESAPSRRQPPHGLVDGTGYDGNTFSLDQDCAEAVPDSNVDILAWFVAGQIKEALADVPFNPSNDTVDAFTEIVQGYSDADVYELLAGSEHTDWSINPTFFKLLAERVPERPGGILDFFLEDSEQATTGKRPALELVRP